MAMADMQRERKAFALAIVFLVSQGRQAGILVEEEKGEKREEFKSYSSVRAKALGPRCQLETAQALARAPRDATEHGGSPELEALPSDVPGLGLSRCSLGPTLNPLNILSNTSCLFVPHAYSPSRLGDLERL